MDRKRKLDLTTTGADRDGNGFPSAAGGANDDGPSVNPYTGVPYSPRYYGILKTRKGERMVERGS